MSSEVRSDEKHGRKKHVLTWAKKRAAEYITAVLQNEDRRGLTLLFSHVPTIRVVPKEVREAHLSSLIAPFGKPYGERFRILFEEVGNKVDEAYRDRREPRKLPKVINIMTIDSWEKVIVRQGAYEAATPEHIEMLVQNIKTWTDMNGFELRLVSDTELDCHPKGLARRARAWETIARVGQSLVLYRAWDLSMWWSSTDNVLITETDLLLRELRDLSRKAPLEYYLEWAKTGKRPEPPDLPPKPLQ